MPKNKILVAEANPNILEIIKSSFDAANTELITATDGTFVLKYLQQNEPDLIIVNLALPKLDGRHILKLLNAHRNEGNPIIAITGTDQKDFDSFEIYGIEGFLSKPLNASHLKDIIKSLLSKPHKENDGSSPENINLNLGIIASRHNWKTYLPALLKNEQFRILGVYVSETNQDIIDYIENHNIQVIESADSLLEMGNLDIIINSDIDLDATLQKKIEDMKINVISGKSFLLLWHLFYEKERLIKKERTKIYEFDEKVKEFSIINELSRIITSTIEMDALLDNIIELCVKVTETTAGTIIMYDDRINKFTVWRSLGLSEKFGTRVKLPLSDPIIEDIITIRKEVTISNLQDVYPSVLPDAASKEGMRSMLALPLLIKEKLIGILCIFSEKKQRFLGKEKALLSNMAGQIAISIENAQLYKSSREKQLLVEQLLSKVIVAQEEERKRIAGEIHDSIAQLMVGILTKVQTSQSLLTVNPEKVLEELEDLRKIVSESVKEVREIIFNLRPSSLDDLGLVPSIENVIKRIEKESNIEIQVIVNERDRRLPPIFETVAFRTIQEALINVKKHSNAKKAWVELYFEPSRIWIKIVDNGVGFNWESVSQKFTEGDSFGLQTMKERASLVGGSVDIISEENKGTTVSVSIPIDRSFVERISTKTKMVI